MLISDSLTCRKRRVKCDEAHPKCGNCIRVDRDCGYAPNKQKPRRKLPAYYLKAKEATHTNSHISCDDAQNLIPLLQDITGDVGPKTPSVPSTVEPKAIITTSTVVEDERPISHECFLPSPNSDNIDGLPDAYCKVGLPSPQTPPPCPWPTPEAESPNWNATIFGHFEEFSVGEPQTETWNTHARIELTQEETVFFEHYITMVGPVLDIFDPENHFTNLVPQLSLRNPGLLKSVLAVGACHLALNSPQSPDSGELPPSPIMLDIMHRNHGKLSGVFQTAENLYCEALEYLANNITYPMYAASDEILTTVMMISTYEMIRSHTETGKSNSIWGQHLKGAFWILRLQGNDGETSDGLRHAVWWAWVRQDIWAALREGRPTLTVWQPKTPLSDLPTAHLAERILYFTAKCVKYAAIQKERRNITDDIKIGEDLLRALDEWRELLPSSFDPIPCGSTQVLPKFAFSTPRNLFQPIWIHPPSHAAAIQMYHFARMIVLLINRH